VRPFADLVSLRIEEDEARLRVTESERRVVGNDEVLVDQDILIDGRYPPFAA
jgi:hypothetical protein